MSTPICLEFAVFDGRIVYSRFSDGTVSASPLLADGEMVAVDTENVPAGLEWRPSGLTAEQGEGASHV